MDGTGRDRKQEPTKIGISTLRTDLTEIVDLVAETGGRIVVTLLGRKLVAMVPLADLKRLEDTDMAEPAAKVA